MTSPKNASNQSGGWWTNLAPYRKTVTAVVTGAIGWATMVVVSESVPVTASEWIALATALATAIGVYGVENKG